MELSYKVIYLPPYTTQWAPIENWFGWIKVILRKRNKESLISLSKRSNYNYTVEKTKELNVDAIKKMFRLIGIKDFNDKITC